MTPTLPSSKRTPVTTEANTPSGMAPVYARDFPGLALGPQLPAVRLAIEIVK